MIPRFLIVGAGGFLGAIARYGVTVLVARVWHRPFPLATFVINVSGSFILGLFATWALQRSGLSHAWWLLVATGFVGAYTTFSTLEYESWRLTDSGAASLALANLVASVVAGFLAVQLGVRLAR